MAEKTTYDLLLRGGRVICPASGIDGVRDIAIRDGRIKPGQLVLMDVFGAGLTYGSVLARV